MYFNVAKQFTDAPGGRLRKNGPKSGEELRDDYIIPLLRSNPNEELVIDFDGIIGIAASVLDEIFYGLVERLGKDIIQRVRIKCDEEPEIAEDALKFMSEAAL